jgi:transcriptional regulator with XRE-family HTH domain
MSATKKRNLFPQQLEIMAGVGKNFQLARKRRKLTANVVSDRAGIHRTTLYEIEKGNPRVSMGAYFNVARALGLETDFLKLAADDELGRKLQDIELSGK